ncbi:MAG TPA: hypothetical protein PKA82_06005 [Pyrinomonadaceae bacterium]|nr:hypothetical protein [Pyrinomonadaceae bacterium]
MKRFTISVVAVSVFFLGIGSLVDRTSAKFKSDEAALALIAKARRAIGADSATAVNGMIIKGRTNRSITIKGETKDVSGETEIAMMLPDKMMKSMKLGDGNHAAGGEQIVEKVVDVVVVGDGGQNVKVDVENELKPVQGQQARVVMKKDDGTVVELKGGEAIKWVAEHKNDAGGEKTIVLKKADGSEMKDKIVMRGEPGETRTWTTEDGKTFTVKTAEGKFHPTMDAHHGQRNNEMLRLTLGLLLTAPQGMDVVYTSGGEADLEGTACNVVVATFAGQSFKLFLDRSTDIPVGMTFTGMGMPKIMKFEGKPMQGSADGKKEVVVFDRVVAAPADGKKGDVVMMRTAGGPHEAKEITVKFSDFRSTGGIQLPYKWTQTIGGNVDEVFTVDSYDINPANIADRFNNENVKVRVAKPATK